ncbi:hypothetical protein MANES_05G005700v8 [Manihot esculenta]|uniref:Kazal-like domain-containing protein n=1 Tax=Manihot esculenta TaxID=3983 RepID=A0A2C9VS45_MANES|nr:hypothetical protein MANES_05G005700v8 [Manihot esculenta]
MDTLKRAALLCLIAALVVGLCLSMVEAQSGQRNLCAGFDPPGGCPIRCIRYDPVCGANGVTYGCGCPDAACAGARVVKLGAC